MNIKNIREKYYGKKATLNGKPAIICGGKLDFAEIAFINEPFSVSFSWQAVERVMQNKNGKFEA